WVTSETAEGPGVKAFQVGPTLPDPLISAVQASGGHDHPTFYVGNAAPTVTNLVGSLGLWKLRPGDTAWRQIVPHTGPQSPARGPTIARRFFVDPYRPQLVYVIGEDHVYRTDDGGSSWTVDGSLDAAVTESGGYPYDVGDTTKPGKDTANPAEAVIREMQFDPH